METRPVQDTPPLTMWAPCSAPILDGYEVPRAADVPDDEPEESSA
jgi:hypothetical protein